VALVIAGLFGEGCFAGLSTESVPFLYIGFAESFAELFEGFVGFGGSGPQLFP